jgi:carbon monoxide dehydrogenase subunit G
MPTKAFTHTVHVQASPAQVWAALQRLETWAHLGPIESVDNEIRSNDGTLQSFRWYANAAGRTIDGTATTVDSTTNERLSLDLDAGEVSGSLVTELAEDASTRITVTLDIASKGPLVALFFPAIAEAIGNGFPGQVEEMAAAL